MKVSGLGRFCRVARSPAWRRGQTVTMTSRVQRAGAGRPADRRHRIEVFCDAYGIAVPGDITGRVAWQQRLVMR